MPTYQYKCEICGNKFEVRRKMSESDKELKCPRCGAEQRRKISSRFNSILGSLDTMRKWAFSSCI